MSNTSSYFWGRVAADGSPIIINRDLFLQHAHILGNSGAGKSSMRLAPLIEQTIGFGDTSLIFIDLKADKLENLAACISAKEELKRRTKKDIPVRVFTLERGKPSHVFNPFLTGGLNSMGFADRVSLITEPLGLFYGVEYGQGHFSAKNSATGARMPDRKSRYPIVSRAVLRDDDAGRGLDIVRRIPASQRLYPSGRDRSITGWL